VVAEGAGQDHLPPNMDTDASGNRKPGDIGIFLKSFIATGLADLDVKMKYIDPSYLIRAAPPSAADAIFCGRLSEHAVHAAMAGKTSVVIGLWGGRFTHVPLAVVAHESKRLDLDGAFWRSVREATGQPSLLST